MTSADLMAATAFKTIKRFCAATILVFLLSALPLLAQQAPASQQFRLSGQVRSTDGKPISGATISLPGPAPATVAPARTETDPNGQFSISAEQGTQRIQVQADQYAPFSIELNVQSDRDLAIQLQPSSEVTVTAQESILAPDPATQSYSRDDLLEANPGRPGVPLEIPGFPVETASGGIKAPQYFAPGIAGDHGEPIAQFFKIGGSLFQNNLSANAHGNGYSDPNIVIAGTVGAVQVDNAAFNARYGDHSVNLAVTYDLKNRLTPFIQTSSDGRDGGISAGWSPQNGKINEWFAGEALFGNGFLGRPEGRQQYKLNAYRTWLIGRNELTAFGLAYYGFSRIPGLIPFDVPVQDDTIDSRQSDLTHTTLAILTDTWRATNDKLDISGWFRTYSLELKSDFGLGLLRQSEFRTATGGNATYTHRFNDKFGALAGLDVRRDAPRDLNLSHADAQGIFRIVTSNNLTITDVAPFVAFNANLNRNLQFYAGVRHDQVLFNNQDLITAANSFDKWTGVTNPKASITLGHPDASFLPSVAFSFGKAFHVNDPRIGSGTARGKLLIQSRAYQMVATKDIAGTELQVTLARVSNSAQLAKIDPDTGLQQNVGPSINHYITIAARRRYRYGFLQASYSQANAVDLDSNQFSPEAPRLIIDATGTLNRLPWSLQAKTEYSYVGEKPLGDGFRAVPIQEIRIDLQKVFGDGRWITGISSNIASGHTGQTLETFALPGEPNPFERIVGVPLRSYATLSLTYQFRH